MALTPTIRPCVGGEAVYKNAEPSFYRLVVVRRAPQPTNLQYLLLYVQIYSENQQSQKCELFAPSALSHHFNLTARIKFLCSAKSCHSCGGIYITDV